MDRWELTHDLSLAASGSLHLRMNNDICYLFLWMILYLVLCCKLGSRWRWAYSFAKICFHMWSVEVIEDYSTDDNVDD
jgi:hypothetical protein